MTVAAVYTIQVIEDPAGSDFLGVRELDELMLETEENLTDLLPDGYRARIRRWDDFTDEPTQEDNDE